MRDVAVCLLPGTEIAFDDNIVVGIWSAWAPTWYAHDTKVGRFKQLDPAALYTHHDALELPDGTHVRLHDMKEGQTATVLQLPAAPKTEAEAQEQKRVEVVA